MRAAVVGAGPVGRIHARALMNNRDVELVAICGRTAQKTEALAGAAGARAYLSVDDLMKREHPNLVCVCTGNQDHVDPVLTALQERAHVFVEKPMAWRVDDARHMVKTAEERDVMLGVNFNHRFSTPFRRAFDWQLSGNLGTLAYVDMKFCGDLYKDLDDPYCQLIETQGHSFDIMRLVGGEVDEVHAFLADPRKMGVYTSAAVTVRFANGAVGTLLGSWDGSYAHPAAQVLEASGTEGRFVVDNVVDSVRLFRHNEDVYTEWRPGLFDDEARDFWRTIDAHIDAFVSALGAGRKPPVSGRDGLKALELTYAAIRSFEEGRSVRPQELS
ncbi:Gfo/Idh/MocA family oxidoreductase [soil metagenome]